MSGRWLLLSFFGLACATTPPDPRPPATPPPATRAAAKPEPPEQAVATPTPAGETTVPPSRPVPEPEPDFEPLKIGDVQMQRAIAVQGLVRQASRDHGVDANLINGVIWTESKFNPKARNRSGAKGLMQLMPVTAKGMAKRLDRPVRVYDPEFSIQAGTKLLSIMLERFDGDVELALFAFGRGGGRVRAWQAAGETDLPDGVQRFIARVRRGQKTFELLGFPNV